MIELRWVEFGRNRQLEYRYLTMGVDASGALCPGNDWSDWKIVPTVTGEEAALQDLIASGGVGATP
jgi:hypothetical protein